MISFLPAVQKQGAGHRSLIHYCQEAFHNWMAFRIVSYHGGVPSQKHLSEKQDFDYNCPALTKLIRERWKKQESNK